MSKIMLNKNLEIKGSFSFRAALHDEVKPPVLEITGVLETDSPVFDEIKSLENERYKIDGIEVKEEAYGSEEDKVNYLFSARNFEVKPKKAGVNTVDG